MPSTIRRQQKRDTHAPAWVGLESLEGRTLLAAAFPTAFDQYMVELINRARLDPDAEAARHGIDLNEGLTPGTLSNEPREPLALNLFATSAAQLHTADLFANFTDLPPNHVGSDGKDPSARVAAAAGGSVGSVAENNSWVSHSGAVNTAAVDKLHALLFKDFTSSFEVVGRGHRKVMLNGTRNEVGAAVLSGKFGSKNAAITTTDLFTSSTNYLTGVAFNDSTKKDNFYTPGEGLGGVTITATRAGDNAVFQTTTWDAGGYSLALAAGTYDIVASGGGLASPISFDDVVIGSANVKRDFISSSGGGGGGGGPATPADLTGVLSLKKPLAAMVPGDKIALNLAVTNSGQTAADAFTIKLYRSTDNVLNTSTDALLITVQSTKPIAPGKIAKFTINLVPDATMPTGDSFFIANIDALGVVTETSDANNAASAAAPNLRWSAGTFADRKNVKLTLLDQNNIPTTITHKGNGEAAITLTPDGFDIDITGSDAGSSLAIASASQNAVHDITTHGNALKEIKAPQSLLTGDINTGPIAKIQFDDVADNHQINITNTAIGSATVAFIFDQVNELSITSAIPIKSYTATQHLDRDNDPDIITAPSIAAITIKGDFEASLRLTDRSAKATLGKLTVAGVVRNARIDSAGHIGAITLGGSENVSYYAGVANGSPALPATLEQLGAFSIKSFTHKPGIGSFINSFIAAKAIAKVTLSNVDAENDGTRFGIVADTLGLFAVTPPSAALPPLKKADLAADDASGDPDDDFIIRLL